MKRHGLIYASLLIASLLATSCSFSIENFLQTQSKDEQEFKENEDEHNPVKPEEETKPETQEPPEDTEKPEVPETPETPKLQ